jgi:hypothetical protein
MEDYLKPEGSYDCGQSWMSMLDIMSLSWGQPALPHHGVRDQQGARVLVEEGALGEET